MNDRTANDSRQTDQIDLNTLVTDWTKAAVYRHQVFSSVRHRHFLAMLRHPLTLMGRYSTK